MCAAVFVYSDQTTVRFRICSYNLIDGLFGSSSSDQEFHDLPVHSLATYTDGRWDTMARDKPTAWISGEIRRERFWSIGTARDNTSNSSLRKRRRRLNASCLSFSEKG
jgi:hypothetical protein